LVQTAVLRKRRRAGCSMLIEHAAAHRRIGVERPQHNLIG